MVSHRKQASPPRPAVAAGSRRDAVRPCVACGTPASLADPTLLTERAAAALLQVSRGTLRMWRLLDQGPPVVHMSPRILRYRPEDVAAWVAARLRTSSAGRPRMRATP